MKLNDVVGLRPTLEKIAGKEMDGAAALEFANFTREILKSIQTFEMKRAELFRKYGEELGEGEEKRIQVKPEHEKAFNSAIKRGLSKELDLEPFDIAALGIKIAPTDLVNATGLFK
jgi:hypothetical protein